MKNMKTLLLLSTSLLFVSCIKETKTVSKETNNSGVADCVYTYSCSGGTTSSAGGGTTTTTGSSTGGTTGINDTYDPNWGDNYPGLSLLSNSCTDATGAGAETRQVTVTAAGDFSYSPLLSNITSFQNTSELLKSINGVQTLLDADSILKMRLKIKPEPYSAGTGGNVCFGRSSGSTSKGYTKLMFNVKIYGYRNGAKQYITTKSYTTNINGCTPAISLGNYLGNYDYIFFDITDVMSNTMFTPNDYSQNGFYNSNSFEKVPNTKCWSMDIEVASDGTKTFN